MTTIHPRRKAVERKSKHEARGGEHRKEKQARHGVPRQTDPQTEFRPYRRLSILSFSRSGPTEKQSVKTTMDEDRHNDDDDRDDDDDDDSSKLGSALTDAQQCTLKSGEISWMMWQ